MGTIKGFFYEIKRKISAFFDRGVYAKNLQEKQSLKSVKSKWKFCYLMLAVPIAHFLVFWLYLNIESILMGFREYVGGGNYVWTLKQFKTVFSSFADKESEIHLALGNTLKFFLLNIFIFCISFVFSYWLFKKVPGHRVYRVIFFMPSIISAVVLTMLFKYFIQPDGPLEKIISTLFSIDPNEIPVWLGDERYALKTVFVYSVWTGFGSNLVVVSSAMARVPESVLERTFSNRCSDDLEHLVHFDNRYGIGNFFGKRRNFTFNKRRIENNDHLFLHFCTSKIFVFL